MVIILKITVILFCFGIYLFLPVPPYASFFSSTPRFKPSLFTCSWLEAMEIQKKTKTKKKDKKRKQYFKQQLDISITLSFYRFLYGNYFQRQCKPYCIQFFSAVWKIYLPKRCKIIMMHQLNFKLVERWESMQCKLFKTESCEHKTTYSASSDTAVLGPNLQDQI